MLVSKLAKFTLMLHSNFKEVVKDDLRQSSIFEVFMIPNHVPPKAEMNKRLCNPSVSEKRVRAGFLNYVLVVSTLAMHF